LNGIFYRQNALYIDLLRKKVIFVINNIIYSDMGITKKQGFTLRINEMADILKAMGNPARLKIIQFLIESKSCVCGDFLEVLPLAQSTVSKHLSELKRVKLITGKNVGNNISYSLNIKTWEKIKEFMLNEIGFEKED
jgi:DNA-binding transcriptional ArsR family regulator